MGADVDADEVNASGVLENSSALRARSSLGGCEEMGSGIEGGGGARGSLMMGEGLFVGGEGVRSGSWAELSSVVSDGVSCPKISSPSESSSPKEKSSN